MHKCIWKNMMHTILFILRIFSCHSWSSQDSTISLTSIFVRHHYKLIPCKIFYESLILSIFRMIGGSLLATYVLHTFIFLVVGFILEHKLLTTMYIMVLVCNFRMHLNKENWKKIWSFCMRTKYSEDLCILCKFVANLVCDLSQPSAWKRIQSFCINFHSTLSTSICKCVIARSTQYQHHFF